MGNPDIDFEDLLPPLRLALQTRPLPLPLARLIFIYPSKIEIPLDSSNLEGGPSAKSGPSAAFTFIYVLSSQLFPYLSPREVVLRNDNPSSSRWGYTALAQLDTEFLYSWNDLERVVLDGQRICFMMFERGYEEIDLVALWARRMERDDDEQEKKALEIHFNFAEAVLPHKGIGLKAFVVEGGVFRDTTELVDLKVVLRVRREDEEILAKGMSEMEEWMRKLMTVELV